MQFKQTLDFTKYSILAFTFILIKFIVFSLLLKYDNEILNMITLENSYIESLGAFFFFTTGIILCYSAYISRQKYTAWILFVIGVAFFFASGEEISWGQKLFSFETPEYWIQINEQNETNIHNTHKYFFDRFYEISVFLLIIVSAIMKRMKKVEIFGVILPSTVLLFSFAIIMFYRQYPFFMKIHYLNIFYVFIAIAYTIECMLKGKFLFAATASFSLFSMITIAIFNISFQDSFGPNRANEIREYLFAFVCFIYSIEILYSIKKREFNKSYSTQVNAHQN